MKDKKPGEIDYPTVWWESKPVTVKCPLCNGKGGELTGKEQEWSPCPNCGGAGEKIVK